jgi:uncharacterized protein YjbI with pentapeptide repeats
MTSEEIKKVLDLHQKWLNKEQGGERANLSGADLSEANLHRANLRGADLYKADLHKANLHWADLREADLRGVNLSEAYLRGANLRGAFLCGADLSGADLDFSCFPLWCGGSRFKCDTKLVYQLLAHICTLEFDDTEGIKDLIMPFAVKSHRAVDLGLKGELE